MTLQELFDSKNVKTQPTVVEMIGGMNRKYSEKEEVEPKRIDGTVPDKGRLLENIERMGLPSQIELLKEEIEKLENGVFPTEYEEERQELVAVLRRRVREQERFYKKNCYYMEEPKREFVGEVL